MKGMSSAFRGKNKPNETNELGPGTMNSLEYVKSVRKD